MHHRTVLVVGALLASLVITFTACQSTGNAGSSGPFFEFSGDDLLRPEGYREWVFVGTPLTPNDLNGGKAAFPEFHSVYIDPQSFAHYERTGEFRDGTILVKELVSVGSKAAVSGKGYFMGDFIGLEATIKSSTRFPNEPGNWAYFSFSDANGGPTKESAAAFPTASCNACHAGQAADDFVFTQYYPVLAAAKQAAGLAANALDSGAQPFTIDEQGALARPVGYRRWVYVGEPVTPNDRNDGKAAFPEFHSVYIDPQSFAHYERTGEFRDGTILVKELLSVGSKAAVSGKGYFMGDFIGLEATVKSSRHFPDEPGNWAYFSFTGQDGGPIKEAAMAFPTASCNACHAGQAKQDFVFTQYYPVLRAAGGEAMAGKRMAAGEAAPADEWAATAPTPTGTIGGVPMDKGALHAYLRAGAYKAYPAQQARTHPGRGPHTSVTAPVRVFYNEVLSASMQAGNEEHPVGSASVKEMFSDQGELSGWAVMVKTQQRSQDGQGWFWYEATSVSDPTELAASGNGVTGCVSCHSFRDQDMILSGFPLK